MQARGDQLEIACGHSLFKLNGLPSEEFTNLPVIDFEERMEGLGRILAPADQDHVVRGVHGGKPANPQRCAVGASRIRRCAWWRPTAIGWRRWSSSRIPRRAGSADLIVPPVALGQVERLFDQDGTLTVARGGNHLAFCSDDKEVYHTPD